MAIFGEHSERVTTGVALVVGVLIIGVIDNFYLMWAVFGLIYLLAFKEALRLFSIDNQLLLIPAALLWLVALYYPSGDDLFVLAGMIYAGAIAYKRTLTWKNFLPFVYPTAGMLFMFSMYQEYGVVSLLWLLILVAMTDVGAYFVGKSIGKTSFCQTSPNKTLEGVLGGIVVATLSGSLMGLYMVDFTTSLIISFLVSTSSIFGDLYESYLKRAADVKDSGDILPGHGGVLDRIDGYLFGGIMMLVLLRGLV